VQSFKALQHITCQGKEYGPGEIIPGATSFQNLKEMIEWRYIGYASETEIKTWQAQQDELAELEKQQAQQVAEEQAKQAEEEQAKQAQLAKELEEANEKSSQKQKPEKPPK